MTRDTANTPSHSHAGKILSRARVADVMTREVMALRPDDSFDRAVSLMANSHFHHFVAIDASGRIAGVISDRDILRALTRPASWQQKPISEIMTRDPLTVQPETSLSEAVANMLTRRINCLPVVDGNGKLCGILTSTDLLSSYHRLLESFEL